MMFSFLNTRSVILRSSSNILCGYPSFSRSYTGFYVASYSRSACFPSDLLLRSVSRIQKGSLRSWSRCESVEGARSYSEEG